MISWVRNEGSVLSRGAYLELRGGRRPRLAHGVCAMHVADGGGGSGGDKNNKDRLSALVANDRIGRGKSQALMR